MTEWDKLISFQSNLPDNVPGGVATSPDAPMAPYDIDVSVPGVPGFDTEITKDTAIWF